jgi:hypothetical protein
MRRLRVNPQGWSPSKSEKSNHESERAKVDLTLDARTDPPADFAFGLQQAASTLVSADLPSGEGGSLPLPNRTKQQNLKSDA